MQPESQRVRSSCPRHATLGFLQGLDLVTGLTEHLGVLGDVLSAFLEVDHMVPLHVSRETEPVALSATSTLSIPEIHTEALEALPCDARRARDMSTPRHFLVRCTA